MGLNLIERLGQWWGGWMSRRLYANALRQHRERLASGQPYFPTPPARLLFICHGNICRSPFAQAYWNQKVAPAHPALAACQAESAGFFDQIGRGVPSRFEPLMRQDHGLDLSAHRSRMIERGLVERADAIFVMDRSNWADMLRTYPAAREKVFLVGVFAPEPSVEIADPYMMDESQARQVYRHLARALETLGQLMAQR